MASLRVSDDVKGDLDSLMAAKLQERFEKAKGSERKELFLALANKRYGLSYNEVLKELIKKYKE